MMSSNTTSPSIFPIKYYTSGFYGLGAVFAMLVLVGIAYHVQQQKLQNRTNTTSADGENSTFNNPLLQFTAPTAMEVHSPSSSSEYKGPQI